MRTKAARQIRAGIMSRCLPYTRGQDDGMYYTVLSFVRMRTYLTEWERWKHTRLARKAHDRTQPFTRDYAEAH